MPEMQAARDALSHLLVGLHDVDDSVVRGEKKFGEQTYAVAYVDFADEIVERSLHLRDFRDDREPGGWSDTGVWAILDEEWAAARGSRDGAASETAS